MKSTAFVINTSRGDLIHESDLVEALQEQQIAGAGLDVLSVEPPPPDHPLLLMDNVIVTGHSAASTIEASHDWVAEWKSTLESILNAEMPSSCVNPSVKPKLELRYGAP